MQAIPAEYFLMPQHHRAKKTKREMRRQTALEDEEMDLCSSPPRRQLPARNECMQALQAKLEGLHKKLGEIESKVVLLDYEPKKGRNNRFLACPTRLSTIYECDDATVLKDEQI